MAFYNVADNTDTVFSSDVDQFSDALTGKNDVGTISLFQPLSLPGAPTVAVNTTAGNLNGAYRYAVAFITGYWKGAIGTGTLQTQGNTGGGTASATVSPSAQQVNVTVIPTGPVGTVARAIYRTKAGGSTFYLLTTINDNTTTSITDNVADTSLGAQMPTTNTTGTSLNVGGTVINNQGMITLQNGQMIMAQGGASLFTISGGTFIVKPGDSSHDTFWMENINGTAIFKATLANAIVTLNNTLDDGSGAASFASDVTISHPAGASQWSHSLELKSTDASSNEIINNIQANGGALRLNASGIAGWGTVVATKNNTLDDGAGNISATGGIATSSTSLAFNISSTTGDRGYGLGSKIILGNFPGWDANTLYINTYNNGTGPASTFSNGVSVQGNLTVTGASLTVGGQQVLAGSVIKSVQRGVITPSTMSQTVTISSVNTAKAELNLLSIPDQMYGSATYGITIQLTSATSILITTGNANYIPISWEVIEYV